MPKLSSDPNSCQLCWLHHTSLSLAGSHLLAAFLGKTWRLWHLPMWGSPSKSRIHSSSLAQWPLCFSMEGPFIECSQSSKFPTSERLRSSSVHLDPYFCVEVRSCSPGQHGADWMQMSSTVSGWLCKRRQAVHRQGPGVQGWAGLFRFSHCVHSQKHKPPDIDVQRESTV